MEKVNHPKHYNSGAIETIEYIKSMGIAEEFCIGNAIKYISRYNSKGTPKEDLKKAVWYLEYAIGLLEEKSS